MADQPPDQLIAPEASMSNGVPNVNIQSLPYDYICSCVKFAQDNGWYPDNVAFQSDPTAPDDEQYSDDPSWSVPSPLNFATNRRDPKPNGSNSLSSNPPNGSTFVDPDHHPSSHAQHDSNVSITNDLDMDIDTDTLSVSPNTRQPQASEPPTNDATISHPEETQQPHHSSSTGEEPNGKAIAILNNYDPLWVQNTGADPNSVFESYSKMKFEQLFLDGVIQKGDRLVIVYTSAFSHAFDSKEKHFATLTVCDLIPSRLRFLQPRSA